MNGMLNRIIQWALPLLLALAVPSPAQAGTETRPISPDEKRALVETVCEKIREVYPFEKIGVQTSDGLREQLLDGGFNEIDTSRAFAGAVTERMEELSNDKHLDLYFDPVMAAELIERERSGDAQDGPGDHFLEQARWENFGFRTLRMLDGQVGYLDLRMFCATRHAGPTAVTAMEFLSRSRAVIIDLRRNGGGWDAMVTLLAGHFIDTGESECASISRSTLDGSYFASMIPAFAPGGHMTEIPLYLLTSSSTASAAEAFSSILRHYRPGTILVGQTTAGAENPVEYVALDESFVLKIPCYEKIWFGSRPGWEGTGLSPDIESPVDQALETAHLHALEALLEKHTGETAREKLQWGIDGHRARLHPVAVDREILNSYAGKYDTALISVVGSHLFLQFDGRAQRQLLPVAEDTFVVEGRDDLRLRFVSSEGRVVAMERIYSDGYRGLDSRN
jgi:hypothetical protein